MSATTENSTVLYGKSTDIDYLLMDVLVFVFVFRFVFSLSGFFSSFPHVLLSFSLWFLGFCCLLYNSRGLVHCIRYSFIRLICFGTREPNAPVRWPLSVSVYRHVALFMQQPIFWPTPVITPPSTSPSSSLGSIHSNNKTKPQWILAELSMLLTLKNS